MAFVTHANLLEILDIGDFAFGVSRILDDEVPFAGITGHRDRVAFGSDRRGWAPAPGQADFLTSASLASLNKHGTLEIGTLCLDVVGSGPLLLRVERKC